MNGGDGKPEPTEAPAFQPDQNIVVPEIREDDRSDPRNGQRDD